jgi:hypothetical protein
LFNTYAREAAQGANKVYTDYRYQMNVSEDVRDQVALSWRKQSTVSTKGQKYRALNNNILRS